MKASWLVDHFGTKSELARVLGVNPPTVWQYYQNGMDVPKSWVGALWLNKDKGRPVLELYEAKFGTVATNDSPRGGRGTRNNKNNGLESY